MATLALMLRSYAPDAQYADRLVESFRRFNSEDLHLFCVVPATDIPLFQHLGGADVTVMDDEQFAPFLVDEDVHGIRPGYINQEIVKMAFWETGFADNYFCVDSEALFLRPFGFTDFMATDSVPYTVLVEDQELAVEPRYYREHWTTRQESIRRIHDEVGVEDAVLRTCHGHQVMSSRVLRSFRDDFLTPRSWTYADALRFEPLEFTWYNMWLQKSHVIPIHAREPLVKVFHHEGQHMEYLLRGIEHDDMARGYLALVVNSNFERTVAARGGTPASTDTNKPAGLAPYLSYTEVARLIGHKLTSSVKRVTGGR